MADTVDLAKLVVRMEAQSDKYLKDLNKQKEQTKKWQNSVNKNVGSVAKTFRGLAAAAGIAVLTRKIIENTAAQQNAVAQLAQGFKTTSGVVGRSVDQMVAKAGELQKVSIFGDEQIIEAQGQLITFTNIVEDQFDRATIAAMDLSTRMGTDLKSSVLQLGKALNDPVTGMTALTRSGVTFTESQKEMVRALVDSGRSVEAQQLMLAELEKQFGGSAKAARETFGGALSGLSGAFNDLLEGGSGGGLNQTRDSIEELTTMLQDPTFVANTNTFLTAAISGFTKLALLVSKVVEGWAKIADWVITPEARQAIAGMFDESDSSGGAQTFKQKWAAARAKNQEAKNPSAPAVFDASTVQGARSSPMSVNPLDQLALQDELDSKIQIEQEYWEEKERMAQDYADAETRIQGNLQAMRMGLASQAMDLIASNAKEGSAIQKAALIASKALSVAQIIINTQVAATSALMPPPIGLGPVAGIGFAATIKSMGYASAALVAAQAVASFDGGGYTGDGPRSGGLDGKGGFMAMMHPQESVTDHTKGGGGGSGSQNYYDFRGSELSEGRVRAMIEQSGQVLEAKMRNSQARGR